MLDTTEGPCRMRKKLTPNPNFYALYPFRPELELAENKSLRYKVAVSLDAKEHFHLFVSNNWRRSLLPSVQQQTVAVSLVAPSVEGGQQDRLDTAITQLRSWPCPNCCDPIKRNRRWPISTRMRSC